MPPGARGVVKALLVAGGLDPTFGGPPVVLINSAIAAQRAGIETTVVFPVGDDATGIAAVRQRLIGEGIETLTFPLLRRPAGLARRFGLSPAIGRWLRSARTQFDVVHCHGAWVLPTLSVYCSAGRGAPSTVLTPHESLTDFDIGQSRNAVTRTAKLWLRPRYLTRFDLVVFASALEARDSVPAEVAKRAATLVIAHPVFDERAHQPAPHRAVAEAGHLRVGFIGRLHAKKNLDVLVRALAHLPEAVRLIVAGDGPEAAGLRALAGACGVGGRIEWLGFVQGPDKAMFFRRIDVLAMPSDYECFGVAAAEAMAEGVPVLVSPRTGVAEVVEAHGGGLIVAPEANAVAAALETLLHNPDSVPQYAARAAEAAERAFSFAAHGALLRRAYENLRGEAADETAPSVADRSRPSSRP